MELTKDELLYINACPQPGTEFVANTLLSVLKFPGWDATEHRGWHQWNVEQSLMKKGLLRKVSGGRGRGNQLVYVLVI